MALFLGELPIVSRLWHFLVKISMRGSRKLCHRGSNSDNVFLVDEGRRGDPYNTKSGPSSGNGAMIARQGVLASSKGSGPALLKKLYFCDFQEGSMPPPSGSTHDHLITKAIFQVRLSSIFFPFICL